MIQHTLIVNGRERSCVPHAANRPCKWAKARLQATGQLDDWRASQRGHTTYRHGRPAYKRQPKQASYWEAVLALVLMWVAVFAVQFL